MVRFLARLRQDLKEVQKYALADTTQQSYKSYMSAYVEFCESIDFPLVPCDSEQMCLFIIFLHRKLRYTSILKYIGIVRTLHLESGLPDPKLTADFNVKRTLMAVKRRLGAEPTRKTAITPELLLKMFKVLNMNSLGDASFWAICLTALTLWLASYFKRNPKIENTAF